jgi:hypothetical protein
VKEGSELEGGGKHEGEREAEGAGLGGGEGEGGGEEARAAGVLPIIYRFYTIITYLNKISCNWSVLERVILCNRRSNQTSEQGYRGLTKAAWK